MRPRSLGHALALCVISCADSNAAYTACRVDASCSDAAPLCINFVNTAAVGAASICTRECGSNADCPDRGVCVTIPAGRYRALCMKRCAGDAECVIPGSFCADVRPGDRACVPGS